MISIDYLVLSFALIVFLFLFRFFFARVLILCSVFGNFTSFSRFPFYARHFSFSLQRYRSDLSFTFRSSFFAFVFSSLCPVRVLLLLIIIVSFRCNRNLSCKSNLRLHFSASMSKQKSSKKKSKEKAHRSCFVFRYFISYCELPESTIFCNWSKSYAIEIVHKTETFSHSISNERMNKFFSCQMWPVHNPVRIQYEREKKNIKRNREFVSIEFTFR